MQNIDIIAIETMYSIFIYKQKVYESKYNNFKFLLEFIF